MEKVPWGANKSYNWLFGSLYVDWQPTEGSVWLCTGFYSTKTCLQARNSKMGTYFEAPGSNIQGVGEQHVAHEPLVGDH
ncbi:hypothetical protein XENTR_v10020427 [Xenopus tropicalis]|nr:hypothetical protein XENTR_v10020427 [Xenopus tropicalis]